MSSPDTTGSTPIQVWPINFETISSKAKSIANSIWNGIKVTATMDEDIQAKVTICSQFVLGKYLKNDEVRAYFARSVYPAILAATAFAISGKAVIMLGVIYAIKTAINLNRVSPSSSRRAAV